MKTTKQEILVKYAKGCYMSLIHDSTESAMEQIKYLKESGDDFYKSRKFQIVKVTTTIEEEILFSE